MQRIEPDTLIDGRYRIVQQARLRRHGRRLLAEDQQLGRRVALKVLHRRFAEDEQFVERFRREASSAAGLSHPNVVAIFDRGEWDGTYYIAMELRRGPHAQGDRAREGPGAARGGGRPHAPDPARRPLRPQARRRAPRHQAAQRPDRPGRPRPRDRLRHRPRRHLGHDRDRLGHGHRAVPVARAGAGPAGRRPRRPVLDRDRALRAAHRPGAVRRRLAGDGGAQAGLRDAGAARASWCPRSRRRSTPSCCTRWRRTPTGASRTPTSSSPRSRPRARSRSGSRRRRRRRSSRRRPQPLVAVGADRAGAAGDRRRPLPDAAGPSSSTSRT